LCEEKYWKKMCKVDHGVACEYFGHNEVKYGHNEVKYGANNYSWILNGLLA